MIKPSDVIGFAKKHSIKKDHATPDFFEGAILGNGSLGVVACARPDAVVLYFGHNNIWDIRISEEHKDQVGTFGALWQRMLEEKDSFASSEWYRSYNAAVVRSYRKPYPRPYPASSMYLFFDRKEYCVVEQELDLSCGLLTVALERLDGERFFLRLFVSQCADHLYCETVDTNGRPAEIFYKLRLIPHTPTDGLPAYTTLSNGFAQVLPYNDYEGTPRAGVDKSFSVLYRVNGTAEEEGLSTRLNGTTAVTVQVTEGDVEEVCEVREVRSAPFEEALNASQKIWHDYWHCSGVCLDDDFLEHIWYINTYFIRCALNEHCRCPGLFANWMYQSIGTAWHGDYHMNYNTQQPFWGLMGANRQALNMPYVRLAEELLPVSKAWAKEFYQMEGACFPHSAYPVPMTVNPYPSTSWGWEIFETPWTVQGLWWHYTYTKDLELLRKRLYPVMREAALFLVSYMTREGSGCKQDGNYHLFPTVVPELYGMVNGMEKNQDGIADLTLTKFLFNAVLTAIKELGLEREEAELAERIRCILNAYPQYPTAISRRGEVFVSVETEDPDRVIYNVPTNLMPVFPGEDVDGIQTVGQELEIAKRSWRYHYNEGGNDLVFYHLVGARLGILDIEKFKREIRYAQLPNETAADRVTMSGGRYKDDISFDFLSRMGIWFENFALYAVIDECLLWGHTDTVRLFPNWDLSRPAAFCSLRAKGAFLLDAACANGTVTSVTVRSEHGGSFRMENPWECAVDQHGVTYTDRVICARMKPGEELLLQAAPLC